MLRRVIRLGAAATMSAALVLALAAPSTATTTVHSGLQALPCGAIWGHDGLVWGHAAISLHSADGSRQITLAQNMTHYAPPGEPDPIAEATGQLIGDALCEDQTASRQQLQGWRSPLPPRVLTH